MFMDKKVFRAWVMGMLALGFVAGVLCANPLKPKVVGPPLAISDKRERFITQCYEKITFSSRTSTGDAIMDGCTKNALAIFPLGSDNEHTAEKLELDPGR